MYIGDNGILGNAPGIFICMEIQHLASFSLVEDPGIVVLATKLLIISKRGKFTKKGTLQVPFGKAKRSEIISLGGGRVLRPQCPHRCTINSVVSLQQRQSRQSRMPELNAKAIVHISAFFSHNHVLPRQFPSPKVPGETVRYPLCHAKGIPFVADSSASNMKDCTLGQ